MKIETNNDYIFVYLNKYNVINVDDNKLLEKDIRNLFRRLNKYYHMKFKGNYKVDVLIDDYYGVILKIKEDDFSYDYFYSDKLSLNLKIKKIDVLYEISDLYICLDKVEIIKNKGKIYFKLKEKLDDKTYMELIENSQMNFL